MPAGAAVAWALMASLLASPPLLAACELRPLDRASITAGIYDSRNTIRGRWDAVDGALGSDFDVARDFGLRPRTREWVGEATLLLGTRIELRGFGYGYSGSGRGRLESDLTLGGVRFPASADYRGDFGVGIRGVSMTWHVHDEATALGAGLGAVRYTIDGRVAARAQIDALEGRFENAFAEAATLPLLRVAASRVLAGSLRGGLALGYVRKPSGRITGHAADATLELEWFPTPHAGVGLNWRFNRVDLGIDGRRYAGRLRVENGGPQALLTLRW